MSQAEELLNSLSIDEASTYSARASEERIVIGDDRFWVVPNSMKKIAVQYDHNIETITFSIPRYWDTKDMSTMQVYINYLLPDKTPGSYIGDGFGVDPNNSDRLIFSWTISRNVTQLKGNVYALICVKDVDGNGNERVHWNSELCRDLYISEGLETDAPPPVEEYPDIITQLLMRMTTVETINVQKEEMEQILAEARAANDYCDGTVDAIEAAAEGFFNNYANAVKGNISGSIVRVDDVSPMKHSVKCRVHGKNLFDGTLNEGILGNADFYIYTEGDYVSLKTYLKSGTYTMSISNKVYVARTILDGQYSINGIVISPDAPYTFTVYEDGYVGFSMRLDPRTAWDTATTIQIEEGVVATEYESYIDPTTTSLQRFGKNLLDHNLMSESVTLNGVTITRNGSKIKLNGTLTTDSVLLNTNFCFHGILNNKYTLSYEYIGGTINGTSSVCVGASDTAEASRQSWANILMKDRNNSTTYSLNKPYIKHLWLYAMAGVTFNNYTIRIQLETGESATNFEECVSDTYIPDESGNCSVYSVSPITTIATNNKNLVIEAEYNRDTTKMFESYVLTDEAKSEIAERIEGDIAEVFASLNEYATSVIGGDG